MPRNGSHLHENDAEGRESFEAEFASRQSNVLPLDAARNEGQFYGSLIKGRPLSAAQRIGFFFIGIIACAQGLFVVFSAFPRLADAVGMRVFPNANRTVLFAYLPFSLLFLLLGLKFITKAVVPSKAR